MTDVPCKLRFDSNDVEIQALVHLEDVLLTSINTRLQAEAEAAGINT